MWDLFSKLLPEVSLFRKIAIAIVLTAIFTVAGMAFYKYNKTINQLENEKVKNTTIGVELTNTQNMLNDAVATIKEWKGSQLELAQTLKEMSKASQEAKKTLTELSKLYAEHDLFKLSREHPLMLEKIINRGTDAAMRLLSCTTGKQDDCSDGLRQADKSITPGTGTGKNTEDKVDSNN